jgi:hypothetical protein
MKKKKTISKRPRSRALALVPGSAQFENISARRAFTRKFGGFALGYPHYESDAEDYEDEQAEKFSAFCAGAKWASRRILANVRRFHLPNATDEPRPQLARHVRQHGA